MSINPSQPVCTIELTIALAEGASAPTESGPVQAIAAGVAAWADLNAELCPSLAITVDDEGKVTVAVTFEDLQDSQIGLTGALLVDPEDGVARACVRQLGPWIDANPGVIASVNLACSYDVNVLLINDGQ